MLVLNVDDDSDDREMFQEAIDAIDTKIDCVQFENGVKVLEYLAKAKILPDYLFLDINMPKMNGYECVKSIRQIPGNEHIQIVMYSTAFNPKHQDDLKDAGIQYLTKTTSFSERVQSIKMLLLESKELVEKSKK